MSGENPKISIIMPSYNVADYIEQCVDSVINQTLKDIEIIFVDADSTDGTLEILKEYESKDSRITLLISDEKSYGHQMNLAMSHAKGEYIGIVETDDYIDCEMFEKLYGLSNKGEYDIVKSSFIYVNEDTDEIYKDPNIFKEKIPDDKPFNLKDDANILTGHPSIWAAIYKRSFLSINEIEFMEAPGGGWVDNPFFHETACLAKTIRYTDDAYYYYRESNPNSSSNQLSDFTLPIRRMLDNLDVIDKYPECKTEDVLKAVYWRVNIYMDNIQSRDGYEENLPKVRPYIKEMMERLSEPIVLRHFNKKCQLRFAEFLSPIPLLEDGDVIEVPSEEYDRILRVNRLFKSITARYEDENEKLKIRNRKLKKYKKTNDSIVNSTSWKITKPLRGLKRIFK